MTAIELAMAMNAPANILDINNSGITLDMNTGKIGFPVYGLFQFLTEEYGDTHTVTINGQGEIQCEEKLVLYGECGRITAYDLPFYQRALHEAPKMRGVGNPKAFCSGVLRDMAIRNGEFKKVLDPVMEFAREDDPYGMRPSDIEKARKIVAGEYIVKDREPAFYPWERSNRRRYGRR